MKNIVIKLIRLLCTVIPIYYLYRLYEMNVLTMRKLIFVVVLEIILFRSIPLINKLDEYFSKGMSEIIAKLFHKKNKWYCI